jgi:hypothetical protein
MSIFFYVIVREGGRSSNRGLIGLHDVSVSDYWMPRLRGA